MAYVDATAMAFFFIFTQLKKTTHREKKFTGKEEMKEREREHAKMEQRCNQGWLRTFLL